MFEDRNDAGRRLAAELAKRDLGDAVVVLALPRGGVPVAAEVAAALHAPLDVLLVRKIGARMQPELAVAAVAEGDPPVLEIDDETFNATGDTLARVKREAETQAAEIARRRALYRQGRPPLDVSGRTVVLVDDGIATGTTVRAALRALRGQHPARVVLAVPVAPADSRARFRDEVDDLVCLEAPVMFGAVGQVYRHFEQTSDDEVVRLLGRSLALPQRAGARGH